jgi:hypothetical protein
MLLTVKLYCLPCISVPATTSVSLSNGDLVTNTIPVLASLNLQGPTVNDWFVNDIGTAEEACTFRVQELDEGPNT